MTKVTAIKDGQLFTSLEVKGHACFADTGKDLVCAAISAITFGLANAVDLLEGDQNIYFKESSFLVKNISYNIEISHYLSCVVTQLKTLEESYPENIQVSILERRPYEV